METEKEESVSPMFYVGQKVVCTARREWKAKTIYPMVPRRGEVYTVREVTHFGSPGLRLVEIVNPPMHHTEGYLEVCWAQYDIDGHAEFRPVVERKTDISIFREMLREVEQV